MHAAPSVLIAQAETSPPWPGVQSTQRLAIVSHTGRSPVQAPRLSAVHSTQAPVMAQEPVPSRPAQSMSPRQPRHMLLSHTGVVPEHSTLTLHCTQRLVVLLHTEVGLRQAVALAVVHCTHAPLAPQALVPSRAAHSMSARHARHTLPSHTGVAPEHSVSLLHCTQRLLMALQSGVPPVQAMVLIAVHCTQRPEAVLQAGVSPPQSMSFMQGRHSLRSQTGRSPGHCELVRHCTHTLVVSLHCDVAPEQAMVEPAVHWTQAPVLLLQAGVAPEHSLLARQPRQRLFSQKGVVPPQSLLLLQPTQRLVAVLHTDMPTPQAELLVPEHCTQRPALLPEVAHAGVDPPQSMSLAQARQVLVVVLQMGVAPPQSVLLTHCTQRLVVVLHTEVAPVQAVRLVPVHCTQLTPVRHAGVAPEHSLSALQARQRRVVGSHTGAELEQSPALRHWTQRGRLLSQSGVMPEQLALLSSVMPSQSLSTPSQVSVVGEPAVTLQAVMPGPVQTVWPVRRQPPTPTEHDSPKPLHCGIWMVRKHEPVRPAVLR